jgi:hypothetical protein
MKPRAALLLALVLAACAHDKAKAKDKDKEADEFEGLGLVSASSEPPPGVLVPVSDVDLVAVSERGRLLQKMERALVLAYEQGVTRVGGIAPEDVVLPMVDVDPGGKSAQVMFVRWHGESTAELEPLAAERWLLVSILMEPDRVLDVELLAGKVERGSHVARRLHTLLASARTLAKSAPGDLFHLLDVYEREDPTDAGSKILGHVYALSADGDAADFEVVVDEPKTRGKKPSKPPEVRSSRTVHAKGQGAASPIVVQLSQPAPITVARAMLLGPQAGEVPVTARGADPNSSARHFTVSAASGTISAVGGETPSGF